VSTDYICITSSSSSSCSSGGLHKSVGAETSTAAGRQAEASTHSCFPLDIHGLDQGALVRSQASKCYSRHYYRTWLSQLDCTVMRRHTLSWNWNIKLNNTKMLLENAGRLYPIEFKQFPLTSLA